jgi:hypothetical protein
MSKPANILSQLQTQLKNSSDLSYVDDNNIFLGAREGISQFPCIVLEPLNIGEVDHAYPKQRLTMTVAVVGFISITNKDKQIVGDATEKGVMDFENDVKKAICSDITLGGYAIDIALTMTAYEFVEYPTRSFSINCEILFEQVSSTRA